MIIRCLIRRPRTVLFGLIFVVGLFSAMAQEKKDSLSTVQPVPNSSMVEQTPLLSIDHPVLPASFQNTRTLKRFRDKHLSDALLNGLKPHRSSLQLNEELDFAAERRDFVSPLLQTRHAAGVLSWRPTDRMECRCRLLAESKSYGTYPRRLAAEFRLYTYDGCQWPTPLASHREIEFYHRYRLSTGTVECFR